jgi:hypothetical protein
MSVTEAAGTAAKLPLTFACGLYDRMLMRFCWGNVRFLARLPPISHRSIRRNYR